MFLGETFTLDNLYIYLEKLLGIIFIVAFIVLVIRGICDRKKDDRAPRLTVPVTVVSKRTHFSRGRSVGSTYYYVTFQVESGDRMEFSVSGYDYGMLAEGDQGKLSFRGTRFLGFARS